METDAKLFSLSDLYKERMKYEDGLDYPSKVGCSTYDEVLDVLVNLDYEISTFYNQNA